MSEKYLSYAELERAHDTLAKKVRVRDKLIDHVRAEFCKLQDGTQEETLTLLRISMLIGTIR